MTTKTIRIILILMLLTLAGLFITQVYWFKQAFSLQEKQFDEKVNVALRNVADRLLLNDSDTTSRIQPITKMASNAFFVETNCYYSLDLLDSSLRNEFTLRNITTNFDYQILRATDNEIILGNTVHSLLYPSSVACKVRQDEKQNLNFKIMFHNKTTHLLGSMGIWLFSSFSLLLLLGVFVFIVVSILKGKKLMNLKKDFVNNMTHEFKTPIANILVASDAIRNQRTAMSEDKIDKYAEIIQKENNRLNELVNMTLNFSSIEKNEESFTFESLDFHQLIRNSVQAFEPKTTEKNGNIELKLLAQNHHITGDKIHLSNLINNLIDNSLKYSKENPKLRIETQNTSKELKLTWIDNGVGIAKENHSKVFDKFFREETGNIHNTKGYGLGLSYVKQIVEKHRGSISFNSKKGKGTTFIIHLPA